MTWRWLGVAALGLPLIAAIASIPRLGAQIITSELRQNRQRITEVIEPGRPFTGPATIEQRINRQRITTILEEPLVAAPQPAGPAAALGQEIQLQRLTKAQGVQPKPAAKAPELIEKPKGVESKPKQAGATVQPMTIQIVKWTQGRGMTDGQGRRWHLIQGKPRHDEPKELTGWILRSEENPPLFYTSRGDLFRLLWQN